MNTQRLKYIAGIINQNEYYDLTEIKVANPNIPYGITIDNKKIELQVDKDGILYCSSKNLKKIVIFKNKNIKYLYCENNQLTELPELPDSLETLSCKNNQLTQLPELPDSLEILYCSYNQLTELPELPDSLKYLYCENNKLPYTNLT